MIMQSNEKLQNIKVDKFILGYKCKGIEIVTICNLLMI